MNSYGQWENYLGLDDQPDWHYEDNAEKVARYNAAQREFQTILDMLYGKKPMCLETLQCELEELRISLKCDYVGDDFQLQKKQDKQEKNLAAICQFHLNTLVQSI